MRLSPPKRTNEDESGGGPQVASLNDSTVTAQAARQVHEKRELGAPGSLRRDLRRKLHLSRERVHSFAIQWSSYLQELATTGCVFSPYRHGDAVPGTCLRVPDIFPCAVLFVMTACPPLVISVVFPALPTSQFFSPCAPFRPGDDASQDLLPRNPTCWLTKWSSVELSVFICSFSPLFPSAKSLTYFPCWCGFTSHRKFLLSLRRHLGLSRVTGTPHKEKQGAHTGVKRCREEHVIGVYQRRLAQILCSSRGPSEIQNHPQECFPWWERSCSGTKDRPTGTGTCGPSVTTFLPENASIREHRVLSIALETGQKQSCAGGSRNSLESLQSLWSIVHPDVAFPDLEGSPLLAQGPPTCNPILLGDEEFSDRLLDRLWWDSYTHIFIYPLSLSLSCSLSVRV